MDFESNHGGNPFLCDDDFSIPQDKNAAALNPFLSGGDFDFTANNGAELNPFLSGPQEDFTMPQDASSTNPFAMFGVDDNTYNMPAETNTTQLFFNSEPEEAPVQLFNETITNDNSNDFFAIDEPIPQITTTGPQRPPPPARPQIPTTLANNFHFTNEDLGANVVNFSNLDDVSSNKSAGSDSAVPHHAPPPRPVPPSRETQQLIRNVTGAMDATSSDLLERLQATRTPSPTPMRELHTPSPTPDSMRKECFMEQDENDFLMSNDEPAPTATSFQAFQPQATSNDIIDLLDDNSDNNNLPATAQNINISVSGATQDVFGLFDANDDTKIEAIPDPIAAPVVAAVIPPITSAVVPPIPTAPVSVTPITVPPMSVPPIPAPPAISPTQAPPVPPAPVHPVMRPPPPRPPVPMMAKPPKPAETADLMSGIELTKVEDVHESISESSFVPEQDVAKSQHVPIVDNAETNTTVHSMPNNSLAGKTPSPINQQDYFAESAFSSNTAPSEPSSFFHSPEMPVPAQVTHNANFQDDEFDAFAAKFESAAQDNSESQNGHFTDPFGGSGETIVSTEAWGAQTAGDGSASLGFGGDDDAGYDEFLSLRGPPQVPEIPLTRSKRQESADSEDGSPDFAIVIKPKSMGFDDQNSMQTSYNEFVPTLAPPPPRSPGQNTAFADNTPRFNPFDGQTAPEGVAVASAVDLDSLKGPTLGAVSAGVDAMLPQHQPQQFQRSDSQETPPTPLFDDDVSQPLEEFPRVQYSGEGWEMHLRQPNKKKITGQRFWKKVFVRLVYQGDNPVLQLSNTKEDKDPFQELPLQPCYSISDIAAQQFDQYGKIFTVKLQYVFYKERPGVRPGQVTKAERITNKLSQFAAYAIQGDYQGVKEFGSDLRKLGLPVEHAPQISQLLKLGSQNYEDMKQFSVTTEEALFRMPAHRDRALHYKMEEVQITAVDELYLEQDKTGHVCRQIARVRIFFLGFISGMPDLELGVNDIMRQGKEVVGRHDIIPVITEEWIRLEQLEFHTCVLNHEYEGERVIRFKPPDACYIELLRFRVRPPKNRELPLQTKATICVTGNKVEIKCDILVPGFSSRKLGQIPCEDIMLRIPIPECWIYLFRIEKHFRYGSVKSAHRRTGKIKGIERFLGTVETLEQHLIEVTSGSAKYEHQHRAIVWRIHRLPKEGQGAYTNHEFVCRFTLTSYDQIPEELAKYCYLEFTMPSTQVSHTTVRSLSVCGDRDEDPPEKCVRHLARLEYRIEIDHIQGSGPGEYVSATHTSTLRGAPTETVAEQPGEHEKDSDSDSSS